MNRQTGLQKLWRTGAAALSMCACVSLVLADTGGPSGHTADRPCHETAATKITSQVRSPGKASIPIKFVNPARFKARLGEVVKVSLTIVATEDIAQLQAQATTENSLVFADSVSDTSFNKIPAGKHVTLEYTVQPQAEGLSYVNVIISTHSGQGRRMAGYSIPVEIGHTGDIAAAKSAPNLVVAEDGVVLEIMPARDATPAPRPK